MIKLIQRFKMAANIIFLVISCLVIANLLIKMVDNTFLKIIFAVIAIGLDIFRQYIVALGKYYFRINFWKSLPLWIIYLIHVSVVIIASAGFTLSEINAKSETAATYNMEKQSIIDTIKSNESEIKQRNELKAKQNPATWEYKQNASRIDALQKADTAHYIDLGKFKEVKLDVQKDIFDSIGKEININGGKLKLYVFVVIAILIELALLVTSWDIKINQKSTLPEPATIPESTTSELLQFAEALYNDTKKLNGDSVISIKTGIPPERCAEYRRYLSQLQTGNKKVIRTKKGGSISDFTKEELQDYIRNNDLKIA